MCNNVVYSDNVYLIGVHYIEIHTCMERITSVVQEKWDTDLFVPIFSAIEKATGCQAYSVKMGSEDTDRVDIACIRSIS